MNSDDKGLVVGVIAQRRLLFWDFDGVIKESVAVKTEGYVRLFAAFGASAATRIREHHESHGGMSRFEKIPLYLEWVGESADADNVRDYCARFSQCVAEAVIASPWVVGVEDYLRSHSRRQYLVLVTATPQDEMLAILRALNLTECFREVYGAPIAKQSAVASVLQRLGVEASDALMIGDSETDLAAAETNGIDFLLRRTKYNHTLQMRYTGLTFEDLKYESTSVD